MMNLIALLTGLCLVVVCGEFVVLYLQATGTRSQRIWAAVHKEETLLMSLVLGLISGVAVIVGDVADAFGDPDLKAQFLALFQAHPEYVPVVGFGISALFWIVKRGVLSFATTPAASPVPPAAST